MPSQTVLVTGGTGFIGSHVIFQLLEKGYKVKATTRNAEKLRSIFPSTPAERLEIVEVPDLTSDHAGVLKDVDALIHCASPVFTKVGSYQEILEGAYYGSVRVIEAAIEVGVKRIIATSSVSAVTEPDFSNAFGTEPLGPESWGSVPLEKIDTSPTSPGAMYVYQTSKTAAEKKMWEMADKHPEIDLTTILPSMVVGPFVPNYPLTSSSSSLGTNSFIQALLDTPSRRIPPNIIGHLIDVRDVAHIHLLALEAPELANREHKRLISGHQKFKWEELVSILKRRYSDEKIRNRLPADDAEPVMQAHVPLDTSLTAKVLRFDSYISVESAVIAAFDAILDWEERFSSN